MATKRTRTAPITDWRKQARDFLTSELNQLVGMTVVSVILEPDPDGSGEDFPVLVLRKQGSKTDSFAIVQRDAEGNGPGHLRIVVTA